VKAVIFLAQFIFCGLAAATAPDAKKSPYLVTYQLKSSTDAIKAQRIRRMQAVVKEQETLLFKKIRGVAPSDRKSLWLIGASIVSLNGQQASELRSIARQSGTVKKIQKLDHRVSLVSHAPISGNNVTTGLQRIKYPEFRIYHPTITGRGARLGIVDTGIDANHRDLTGKTLAFKDFISGRLAPYDDNGHGTHVAGIIAGGSASGKQIGVAPEAQLYIAKAFSRYGGSEEAKLLLALQWMADPDHNPDTDDAAMIVSNSWNSDRPYENVSPVDDPFCRVVDALSGLGIVVVFAAGNDGPSSSSIKTPGACPNAVTVAATNERDAITDFSSRGPVRWGSVTVPKPDISAPGSSIESAWPGNDYKRMSGTSMAAPYVSGSLALLIQHSGPDKDWAAMLTNSAVDIGRTGFDEAAGAGLLNLLTAMP
jgi:subtilisin family serine protease